jgi:RNA polymerase-interacting CarD/CdnL/TRCF family regulator
MNFNQGDHVVHQKFGVGVVVSVEGMNLTGDQSRLCYRCDFDKTTVWVPVSGQPSGTLRLITPKDHLDRYRRLLESRPVPLDRDFHKRQIELETRMERGTFQGLCEVLRDLHALNALKPLNSYEKGLYRQTRDTLVLEWSAASGLPQSGVKSEIDRCLQLHTKER